MITKQQTWEFLVRHTAALWVAVPKYPQRVINLIAAGFHRHARFSTMNRALIITQAPKTRKVYTAEQWRKRGYLPNSDAKPIYVLARKNNSFMWDPLISMEDTTPTNKAKNILTPYIKLSDIDFTKKEFIGLLNQTFTDTDFASVLTFRAVATRFGLYKDAPNPVVDELPKSPDEMATQILKAFRQAEELVTALYQESGAQPRSA